MNKNGQHTIFFVGDRAKDIDYRKILMAKDVLLGKQALAKFINYQKVWEGHKLPSVDTDNIVFFLFFPFYYWNKHIEFLKTAGTYGNRNFYRKFRIFWDKLKHKLRDAYPEKNIYFLNMPHRLRQCRDKVVMKKLITRAGVRMPKTVRAKDPDKIIEQLQKDKKLFIKPRYGSLGKGITYLTKEDWRTNFLYKNNKLVNRKTDYGWTFHNGITNDRGFLEKLIKEDMIIEEAVDCLSLKNKRVDLRIYVFFGEVLFVYPRRSAFENITTNIAQGGRGEHPRKLAEQFPKKIWEKAKSKAVKATKAMGLNFAGVDVMVDNNMEKVYVIEINSFPGFPRKAVVDMAWHMLKKYSDLEWSKLERMLTK